MKIDLQVYVLWNKHQFKTKQKTFLSFFQFDINQNKQLIVFLNESYLNRPFNLIFE